MRSRTSRFILALALSASMQAAPARAEETVQLASGRHYIAYLPSGGGRAAPLLIAFHGAGETPENLAKFSGLASPATAAGYVVIFPAGLGRSDDHPSWNAGLCCLYAMLHRVDDVGFTADLIADAAARYGIDRRRVFLTGISNGAMLAYRVAAERPELVAGIAAVAGALVTTSGDIKGPVPILDFHGTADKFDAYDRGSGMRFSKLFRTVPETLALWAKANGTSPMPKVSALPAAADDGMTVEKLDYGPGRAPLIHYKINGGGHTWPGRPAPLFLGAATKNIDANAIMLDFFSSLPSR